MTYCNPVPSLVTSDLSNAADASRRLGLLKTRSKSNRVRTDTDADTDKDLVASWLPPECLLRPPGRLAHPGCLLMHPGRLLAHPGGGDDGAETNSSFAWDL